MNMNFSKLQEIVKDKEACCAAVHGVSQSQTQKSDWTTTRITRKTIKKKIASKDKYMLKVSGCTYKASLLVKDKSSKVIYI